MSALSLAPRQLPSLSPAAVPLVSALVMSLLVTAAVSALLTAVNTGLDAGYPARWLRNFAIGWLAAFPLVHFAGPRVRAMLVRASAGR
jgi:flagellar biosynthesis protein FliR